MAPVRRPEPDSDEDEKFIASSSSNVDPHANNPSGKNQWGPVSPLDDRLETVLRDLHKLNIRNTDTLLDELRKQGFKLGRTILFRYKNQLGLGTARRPILTDAEQTQLILTELDKDPNQALGPRSVWQKLGLAGHHLTRDKVAQVMQDYAPEAFQSRAPGQKVIHRTPLVSLGPNEEWSMDGHDKLAKAGFGVYGIRDKYSGFFLHYQVVPSNCYAAVVAILLLECIMKYEVICMQGATDHGSEVGEGYSIHAALREVFAPELIEALIPSWRFLESYRNITVERSWRPTFTKWGQNALDFYSRGLLGGTFEPANDVHSCLKDWIWFPLMQRSLDAFVHEQNHSRVRKQKEKQLPSGGTPRDFYRRPEKFEGEECGIKVDMALVKELHAEAIAKSGHLLKFVDDAFDEAATRVYKAINKPEITLETAWVVFDLMIPHMSLEE
ncbi:hypothetical protein BDZ89DRAFT_1079590 [Hymenopellis radicata]|nr:hypothetical protein BDZ89DRAFT_1079590 [Hymenopellis radicata]